MKGIYLDCSMGAAGDMLMGALYELCTEQQKEDFLSIINSLFPNKVTVTPSRVSRCGIMGTHMDVIIHNEQSHEPHSHNHTHHHEHHHHTYSSICSHIESFSLDESVKKDAIAVYKLLRDAEADVHGMPVEQIHFHEVGNLDAIIDITGCAILISYLKPEKIYSSPVNVGSGTVACAHGILPVPAPAAMKLLQNIPIYSSDIEGELCTPTGAALLRYYVSDFCKLPCSVIKSIGYGMGTKEFACANGLRASFIEIDTIESDAKDVFRDTISELRCNLDDMTPEAIGYASNLLMDAGAVDVYTTPIGMKKERPAVMLTCLCPVEKTDELTKLMLLHTTTLGVRTYTCNRTILKSEYVPVETPFGTIRFKKSYGYGVEKVKPEYEDIKKAANAAKLPFSKIQQEAYLYYEKVSS